MTAYQPGWLRLAEARKHVASALAIQETDAEAWLLRAIQDKLRADPEGYAAQSMFRVESFPTTWKTRGLKVDWPARITADRLSWENSTVNGPDSYRLIDKDLFLEVRAASLPSIGGVENDEAILKPASTAQIRAIIREVYSAPGKPPNINELPKKVRPRLQKLGLDASGNRISEIGNEPEFQKLRRPRGATLASERAK
ncbi:MAG: hypothetical protein WA702_05115 [Bradyrhizobium sp.]|uniref:hypothetical protein n=1 Tax=Bradyrhizobium sp. TaxID=376 RepID=UPI003C79DF4C